MSASCEQIIECCPPTPWDYMIHEPVVWNTRQCATVSCSSPSGPVFGGTPLLDEQGNVLYDEQGDVIYAEPGDVSPFFTACVDAGIYSAETQEEADLLAAQAALAQAKALLDASMVCGFWNTEQCATVTCTPPLEGSSTHCIPDHWYYSAVSQADADAQALQAAQNMAGLGLACAYWNTEQCCTVNCPAGQTGSNTYCVVAHTYSSLVSQNDADTQAHDRACQMATEGLNCEITSQLSGLLWKIPCGTVVPGPAVCYCTDPITQSVLVQGDAGRTYSVTLRIRGAIEFADYTKSDSTEIAGTGGHCRLGGTSSGLYPHANHYSLVIDPDPLNHTVPADTYWLNQIAADAVYGQAHTYAVDYTLTVDIKAGSLVSLPAVTVDGLEYVAGLFGTVVTVGGGDPPLDPSITQPYGGQFLQMDVVSVSS